MRCYDIILHSSKYKILSRDDFYTQRSLNERSVTKTFLRRRQLYEHFSSTPRQCSGSGEWKKASWRRRRGTEKWPLTYWRRSTAATVAIGRPTRPFRFPPQPTSSQRFLPFLARALFVVVITVRRASPSLAVYFYNTIGRFNKHKHTHTQVYIFFSAAGRRYTTRLLSDYYGALL